MTTQKYKLTRATVVFIYTLLGFLLCVGITATYHGFGHEGFSLLQPILIVWLGLFAWICYYYLRIPVTIIWRDDGVLEFKSLLATTRVPVQDIMTVKATLLSWGFIKITYKGGSIKLLCQITGLYELLSRVKAANPAVEITGC